MRITQAEPELRSCPKFKFAVPVYRAWPESVFSYSLRTAWRNASVEWCLRDSLHLPGTRAYGWRAGLDVNAFAKSPAQWRRCSSCLPVIRRPSPVF